MTRIQPAAGQLARTIMLTLVVISLVNGVAGGETAAHSEPALPVSPPGQVLIVNNNVLEAFQEADVADSTDMRNFARRVVNVVPYAPDILLLQEIVGPSAENVARLMTEATGYRYVVAIAPGETVWLPTEPGEDHVRDTAILINSDTIQIEDAGGFISQTHTARERPRTKDHAYLLAKERQGGLQLPLVSLHYPVDTWSSERFVTKGEWSSEIAEFLASTYPLPAQRQVEVIAGDFNNRRCVESGAEAVDCEVMPFWQALTDEHGYTDAIFAGAPEEIGEARRIDFIFTTGAVIDAASDLAYSEALPDRGRCKSYFNQGTPELAPDDCQEHFYSDHRFIWALIGMPTGPDTWSH